MGKGQGLPGNERDRPRHVAATALCSLEAGTEPLIDVTPALIIDSEMGRGRRKHRNTARSEEGSSLAWLEGLMYGEPWTERQDPAYEDVRCQVKTSRLDCEGELEPERLSLVQPPCWVRGAQPVQPRARALSPS